MADVPLIGITMRLEVETRRFYLGKDYCEAIKAAGGSPLHIPLIPDAAYIDDVVSRLDGILLPGCDSDPDPALYGSEPHPKLGRVIPEKDATDLLVIKAAETLGLPILGICYGMQILNVSRGGTLIQDIGTQVESSIQHRQGFPLERKSHKIRIGVGSRLEKWAREVTSDNFFVNSHHHQSVDRLGRDLTATSWASDNVVESMEDASGRSIFAFQWHPELDWQNDESSKRIFRDFIEDCRHREIEHA